MAGRIRFLDADRTTALVERLADRFAALMRDRSLTRRAIGWAAANWLLDAASLWVFVAAFSHFISPVDLLMAYGLANILAAIPITPGGLGVVEFVLVSMITGFGPTAGQALSAVLAYRAVNFWLPIPFGGLAYASLEFERRPTYRKVRGTSTAALDLRRRADRRRRRCRDAGAITGRRPVPTVATTATGGTVDRRPAPAGCGPDGRPARTGGWRPGRGAPRVPEPAPSGAVGTVRLTARRDRRDARACVWK